MPGATDRPCRIPAELSDSAFFTERALTYLQGPQRQAVVPASRLLPPASALHRAGALPRDVPARGHARARARRDAGRRRQRSTRCCALPARHQPGRASSTAPAARRRRCTKPRSAQMRATYCGLMTEIDDQLGRVFAYLEENGPVGRHADRLHLRPRRAARRPLPARQDRLFRRELPHPAGRQGSAGRATTAPARSRTPSPRAIDVMPTILDWLGGSVPRACDGRSLLPLLRGRRRRPTGATELHYEFDFRDVLLLASPRAALGLLDGRERALRRAGRRATNTCTSPRCRRCSSTSRAIPHQFENLAEDPAHAGAGAGLRAEGAVAGACAMPSAR